MQAFQVIFNDVPLAKYNEDIPETHYLPIVRTFQVDHQKELYEKIDAFILDNRLKYSSYEIQLI